MAWAGTQNLYQGSTGSGVEDLQRYLSFLGYDIGKSGADGIFGPDTASALRQFQKDSGIDVDAIAGPDTYSAIQRQIALRSGVGPGLSVGNVPKPSTPTADPETKTETTPKPTGTPSSTPIKPQTPQGTGQPWLDGMVALAQQESSPYYSVPPQMISQTPPTSMDDILSMLSKYQGAQAASMAPYEQMLRDIMANQPLSQAMPEEDMLASARERAALMIDPQRLALQQQIEELQRQAEASRGRIQADYAGAEESVARMLEEARRQATESAIARGGGRSGQVDYFSRKMQEPIAIGHQQQQAQRMARLGDIESALMTSQRQAAQTLSQLAQQEGQITNQQLAALRDAAYGKQTQEWQQALQSALGVAQLAGQHNQYSQNFAANLLPYFTLTEMQRQQLPLEWASQMGIVPDQAPGPAQGIPASSAVNPVTKGDPEELMPVRAYAAALGNPSAVDWDEKTREVIINGTRIPLDQLGAFGGYEKGGTSYLPRAILNQLLGVG